MSVEWSVYRVWADSGGAGSRLNLLACQTLVLGCVNVEQRVYQAVFQEDTLGGMLRGGTVAIPLDEWNGLYRNADTVELVEVTRGVCLRMYTEHIVAMGRVEGSAVVCDLKHWTLYGPGGVVLQPGYLGTLVPAPQRAVVVQSAERVSADAVDAPPSNKTLLEAFREGHKAVILHPKSWTDELIVRCRDDIDQHLGVVLKDENSTSPIALARDVWEAYSHKVHKTRLWSDWPAHVLSNFSLLILPIPDEFQDLFGNLTQEILAAGVGRPAYVWPIKEKYAAPIKSWKRVSKDPTSGWQVNWNRP